MDNKRLIQAMTVAMLLLGVWYFAQSYINRVHPEWQQALATTEPTTPAAVPSAPTTGQSTGPSTLPSLTAGPAGPAMLPATQPTGPAVLGSGTEKDPNFAMQVEISPDGAGIDKVVLNQFHQKVKSPDLYTFQVPYDTHPETNPLGTRTLTIDGNSVDLGGAWNLIHADPSSATFTTDLTVNGKPAVRLTKTYHLPDIHSAEKQGMGYELFVDFRIQNLTDQALTVSSLFNGPTVPPREVERGTDRQVLGAFKDGPASITVTQNVIESFKPGVPIDLTKKDDQPSVWAGAASVYFEALVLPQQGAEGATQTDYTIKAQDLDPDALPHEHVAMTFATGDIKLPPAGSASLPLSVFFGPKKRDMLEQPYFAAFPRQFNKTLVIASGFCAICTFSWLIAVLVKMLGWFHWATRDWGLAIICLVILVRVLLHPITKKSQVHMMRMGKMGPEMERLKKKYGDDKDALNKAMMQFYKEQGLAPVLGCLPMFLQMPIWIALWSALQSTFELRHSPFLFLQLGSFHQHLTWIYDLANPDALISWTPVTIFGFTIDSFNLLPILLSVVFYLQQKYTPKPITTTPEQAQQQKMMMWMSTLLFPIFLYKGPAGLNLYILTSTGIGIIESKIIRDHIKQREEAEKAGRVFVETKATRAARRKDDIDEPPAKKTGVMGWLAALQQRAEELRDQADKRKGLRDKR
jgi:YidC/Oxa1 family membrane protein insertase